MSESILSVKNLNVYYQNLVALKDINITIQNKSVTSLIGPSGCGKSTFLKTLNRMNDFIPGFSMSGKVLYKGTDIYAKKQNAHLLRKQIGMVFQKPTPFHKSIFDNIAYGLKVNGINDKRKIRENVEYALVKAALWEEVKDYLNKDARELSGGQQQRLCIARSIALEPEVLLLDEPTSALDPSSTLKIEQLIRELSRDMAIVIVTHNLQQAKRVSDFTAFFYLGNLIECDSTTEVFSRPKSEETKRYVMGEFG